MEYQALRLTLEPPLASITLARPSQANRIDARSLREVEDACQRLRDDEGIRAVVLQSDGEDFCAGWDAETLAAEFEMPPDPFACLAGMPQPVVCAIQGLAASAGLELALTCDIRICSDDARFSLPETAQGMLPRAGGSQRLPRVAGRGVALAMILAGEELNAAAANRSGLVARVTTRDTLAAEARAIAERIAARGPIATRYAKEAIQRGQDMTLNQALRYETDLTIILQTTEDRAEGVRAFVEKRDKPRFKGR